MKPAIEPKKMRYNSDHHELAETALKFILEASPCSRARGRKAKPAASICQVVFTVAGMLGALYFEKSDPADQHIAPTTSNAIPPISLPLPRVLITDTIFSPNNNTTPANPITRPAMVDLL